MSVENQKVLTTVENETKVKQSDTTVTENRRDPVNKM